MVRGPHHAALKCPFSEREFATVTNTLNYTMTTQGPRSGSRQGTGTYDIKVQGHLDRHWAERLDVPELVHAPDDTRYYAA